MTTLTAPTSHITGSRSHLLEQASSPDTRSEQLAILAFHRDEDVSLAARLNPTLTEEHFLDVCLSLIRTAQRFRRDDDLSYVLAIYRHRYGGVE